MENLNKLGRLEIEQICPLGLLGIRKSTLHLLQAATSANFKVKQLNYFKEILENKFSVFQVFNRRLTKV